MTNRFKTKGRKGRYKPVQGTISYWRGNPSGPDAKGRRSRAQSRKRTKQRRHAYFNQHYMPWTLAIVIVGFVAMLVIAVLYS